MDMENDKDRLKRKIKVLKEQLEDIGEEGSGDIREKGEEYAQMFRERGKEAYRKAKETGNQIDEYAHEHPWVWMGLGVLVGMTIGATASMKSCKKYCR